MSAPTPSRTIRIASRASQLALWQAHYVSDRLRAGDPAVVVEILEVSTTGDRDRFSALSQMGGQGVFTREVQAAVLECRADLAVHSLKDLPTLPTEGLALAGIPERAPRFDALVLPLGKTGTLTDLKPGAKIGTGSLRRRAQLLNRRPDLLLEEVRGNVETRLRKVDEGEYDAVILAEAGLRRLGWSERISCVLSPPEVYPAVGQAALGIECRWDDADMITRLAAISDSPTWSEVRAERACLAELRAGCHAPVGVLTEWTSDLLTLHGVVLSRDGGERIAAQATAPSAHAEAIGRAVAQLLLAQGGDRLMATAEA
ncbi:MAG: hydroxymethylbilane synthase [Planctomycetota bacterium]|nr:MAG: hydroxymethylbilane synthase [Planctomycetota bacterium]